MKKKDYVALPGWFDLSKLKLPMWKFRVYADLQKLGQHYQETYSYQKKFNDAQLGELKEHCAVMQMDLIVNYDALERG